MCEFSVIIPTYNRPRLLAACVESVLAQDFPANCYEVIVVDDGSRRRTVRVLPSYLDGDRVRYLRRRRQGWGAARLVGARNSRGEILAFIDDDCVAPPGWLACYARVYAAHPDADGVGGGLRPGALQPAQRAAGRSGRSGGTGLVHVRREPHLSPRGVAGGAGWGSGVVVL